FSYDLCHFLERLPRPRFNEFQVPDLAVGLFDWVLSFDHAAGRAWLVTTGLPNGRARERLRQIKDILATEVTEVESPRLPMPGRLRHRERVARTIPARREPGGGYQAHQGNSTTRRDARGGRRSRQRAARQRQGPGGKRHDCRSAA